MEFSRHTMAFAQVTIDLCSSMTVLYIAVIVTKSWGLVNKRERLQLVHRVCLVAVSIAFGWHAEDIAMNIEKHGLTATNVFLHLTLISSIVVSGIRMKRLQILNDNGNGHKPYRNGDAIVGPLQAR